jgi:hypothetical protein
MEAAWKRKNTTKRANGTPLAPIEDSDSMEWRYVPQSTSRSFRSLYLQGPEQIKPRMPGESTRSIPP